jgi:DNA helicase-2/ATP-dependent DNA helicase PcrA
LVLEGGAPERILLLTVTRRAALEMTRRAGRIVAEAHRSVRLPWSGTFHCAAVGLTESFSVLDRGGRRRTAAGDVGVISCRKIEKGLNSVR